MADRGPGRGRAARRGAAPSPVAVDRLRRALRAEVAAYADDLDLDLQHDVRDVHAGHPSPTAIDRLEAFQRRVQRVVAGAVAEREAEAVLAAASPARPHQVTDGPAPGPPPAAAPSGSPRPAPRRARRVRTRRLAVGAIAGMLLAAVTGQRLTGG